MRVTGADLLGTHAVLAAQAFLLGALDPRRRVPVQLERSVRHGDLIGVLEVSQRDPEPGQAQRTPGTRIVGPHIDLHAAFTLGVRRSPPTPSPVPATPRRRP